MNKSKFDRMKKHRHSMIAMMQDTRIQRHQSGSDIENGTIKILDGNLNDYQ